MFHQKLSMLAAAAAAALAVFPSLSQAVELGDLKVVSQPGQPLEAVLDVNDVDITISPLLVRVAPPATYLREGVEWPREAQDLKMARMGGEAGKVRVKVVGGQSLSEGFPLLIEMNAGGKVTVFQLQRKCRHRSRRRPPGESCLLRRLRNPPRPLRSR